VLSNYDDNFEFVDTDIEPNITYSYYVKASSKFAGNSYTTNTKTIRIYKEYDALLEEENTNSFDWLFA
jgi:hypothetical protein